MELEGLTVSSAEKTDLSFLNNLNAWENNRAYRCRSIYQPCICSTWSGFIPKTSSNISYSLGWLVMNYSFLFLKCFFYFHSFLKGFSGYSIMSASSCSFFLSMLNFLSFLHFLTSFSSFPSSLFKDTVSLSPGLSCFQQDVCCFGFSCIQIYLFLIVLTFLSLLSLILKLLTIKCLGSVGLWYSYISEFMVFLKFWKLSDIMRKTNYWAKSDKI